MFNWVLSLLDRIPIFRDSLVDAGHSSGASTSFAQMMDMPSDFKPPTVVIRERTIIQPTREVVGAYELSPTELAELDATPLCSRKHCRLPAVWGKKLCIPHGSKIRKAQRQRHARTEQYKK